MALKEVDYILGIYRYGSITKAAEALYITQPALSKFLKNVERQVGAPLFSRVGNDLIPTYVGERYLAYAGKIDALTSAWGSECADLLGEKTGRLSIAIPLMRGSCIIPDVLFRFHRKYPDVQINLTEESHAVEKCLSCSGEIDFAIYSDVTPPSGLMYEELGKEEIVLVMAHDHPLAAKGVRREGRRHPWLDLALARDEQYILHPPELTTGRLSRQLLAAADIVPKLLLQTRNSDLAIRLAATGAAVCFAPESYVEKLSFRHLPACFSIGGPKTEITLYAIYQKGRYLPLYAQYFMNLVKELMRTAPDNAKERRESAEGGV